MAQDYGKRLIVESIVDANTQDQHYDADWSGGYVSVALDMYFHYEGQVRKRKLHALITHKQDEPEDEAQHQRLASIFDDIRTAICNNTAEFYTQGIKTPNTFHKFFSTIPELVRR